MIQLPGNFTCMTENLHRQIQVLKPLYHTNILLEDQKGKTAGKSDTMRAERGEKI